jgi:hypothetical protein
MGEVEKWGQQFFCSVKHTTAFFYSVADCLEHFLLDQPKNSAAGEKIRPPQNFEQFCWFFNDL